MSKYTNENLVLIMIAFIFSTIIFAKLSDYYGYHKYHFYVEFTEKIIPADIDGVDFKSRWASGFIDLKHADFSKSHVHIMGLIYQFVLVNCVNCTIEKNSFQIKSLTKLD